VVETSAEVVSGSGFTAVVETSAEVVSGIGFTAVVETSAEVVSGFGFTAVVETSEVLETSTEVVSGFKGFPSCNKRRPAEAGLTGGTKDFHLPGQSSDEHE